MSDGTAGASLRRRFAGDADGAAVLSLADVVSLVNAELDELETRQPTRRAVDRLDGRTVRYYTSTGVLAPPERQGRTAAYSSHHVLALLAVKACQARGLSLAQIGALVRDASSESLVRLVEAGGAGSAPAAASATTPLAVAAVVRITVAPGCVLELSSQPSDAALTEAAPLLARIAQLLVPTPRTSTKERV